MTLQKIADAVGVSLKTAHRAASDLSFDNSEIVNARGQMRPMHYASRAVETLGSKLRPTLDAISMHYAARAVDTPVRMPPTAPRTGAALRLPVFSTGSTAIPPQNGLQRLAPKWPGVCVRSPFHPGDTCAQFCQLGAQLGNVRKPCQCGGNRRLGDLLSV